MGSCLSKKGSLDVDEDKAPYERAKQGRSSSRSKKNKSKNKPLEADDDGQLEDGTVTDTVKEKPTPVPRKLSLKTASQDKLDAAEGNFDTPKSQPVPRQPIDESRPEKPERTFEYEGDKPHAAPRGVKPAKQETEGTKDNEKKASTPDAVKQSIKVNQTTLAAEVKHVKLKPHPESIQIAPMSDTPPPALKPVTPAVQTKPTIKQRSFDKPDSDANTKRITSEPPVRTNAELIQPIRPGKQHTFDRSGQNSAPVLPPRDVNAFLSDLDYDIPSTGHVVTVPSPRKPLLPPKATEEINPADVIVRIKQASQNQHPSSPVKIPEVTGKTVPPPPPKHPTMNTQDQGLYWVTDVTKQIPKKKKVPTATLR